MKFLRTVKFSTTLHILIWALLLGVPTVLLPNKSFFGLSKSFFFISSVFHIGIFYLNAYLLYPRLLTKKYWWLYILSIVAIIIVVYHIKVYFLQLNPDFQLIEENKRVIIFSLMPFLFASVIFRLISDRIRFERMEKEARAERLDAELKFLRSQISPHFLFNMMANMVSLARQKSDLLEPSLIRLSELLRYLLYDSIEEKIAVSKEVDHIQNYVALQQLRFGEDVNISKEIKNDCPECLVEPMLLVPFIENAFKHGIGMVKTPYIKIKLNVKDHLLEFAVNNNYDPGNFSKDKNSGIGLVNVKNRLDLLYPEKYKLIIADEAGVFSVLLNLNLS